MNLFSKPFRLTSPYSIEPDADAIMSPYEGFEPDQPDEPEKSPYAAQNKAAIEASLGAGTGRRGFSASPNEDAQDASPYDPGFIPASQVPGGYGGSYSAGGTQTPNPAGMAGGRSPASTPTRANVYDDPPLGGDDSPVLDKEDVPRNETDSPYEKMMSPEWAAVARLDEEIAEQKRQGRSIGGILGGLFTDPNSRRSGMNQLLAERAQLVRQAEWSDNRRSTEVSKTVDVVGPDGVKHKYAITKGGQKIDLGVVGDSERERQAKIEAAWRREKAMLENQGKYIIDDETGEAYVINPNTGKREVLTKTKMIEQQGPVRPEDPGLPSVETEVPLKPRPTPTSTQGPKVIAQSTDNEGNLTVLLENPKDPANPITIRRPGIGKKTQPGSDFGDKITPAILAQAGSEYRDWESNPMNMNATAEEKQAKYSAILDRNMAGANVIREQAGKKTPFAPKPEVAGPAAPIPVATYSKSDKLAGKAPVKGDIAEGQTKTGEKVFFRWNGTTWERMGQ